MHICPLAGAPERPLPAARPAVEKQGAPTPLATHLAGTRTLTVGHPSPSHRLVSHTSPPWRQVGASRVHDADGYSCEVASAILLPFHQDERLGDESIVLPDDVRTTRIDPALPLGDQWRRLTVLYDALATEVAARVATGRRSAVVTGDCLATLGTLTGLQRAGLDPSIVWFDAHGDIHTLASSSSGYLGGMALRMALGGDAGMLSAPLGLRPLSEEQAVLVDARDLDPAEVDYLAGSEVLRAQVDEIEPDGLPEGPLLLHVDVDVIDAGEVPGLRFPVGDGPTAGAVLAAVDRLLAGGRVTVLDVACPWFAPVDLTQTRRRTGLLSEFLARAVGAEGT